MIRPLAHQILRPPNRGFFMHHVKGPLRKAIHLAAKMYPEPTHENVKLPNSHSLIDMMDSFIERIQEATYSDTPAQKQLWGDFWRIFICEYEHDPDYRFPFEVILRELVKLVNSGEWEDTMRPRPPHWKGKGLRKDKNGDWIE